MLQERIQWWVIVPGFFPFCKNFVKNMVKTCVHVYEEFRVKYSQSCCRKEEKNMEATFSPVKSPLAPLKHLLINMESLEVLWRSCF